MIEVQKESEFDRVRTVKERIEAELLKKNGVVGCAVGYETVGDKETARPAIICFVNKKLPRSELGGRDLLPEEVDGVPVDVIEVGSLQAGRKPERLDGS